MTWAAFEASIEWARTTPSPYAWQSLAGGFTEFSSTTSIRSALSGLYSTSTTARGLMEDILSSGLPLRFGQHAETGIFVGTSTGGGTPLTLQVGFNPTNIANFYYINETGKLVQEIPALTFIHELAHAALFAASQPYEDPIKGQLNNTNYDQDGAILPLQNLIATQMGWGDHRQASYHATMLSTETAIFGVDLIANQDYTDGKTIDNARFGTTGADNLNHSSNTINLRDLFFGFAGNDTISAGDGDDYVYGGSGIDQIGGGGGDDVLYGGSDDDVINGGDDDDFLSGGGGNNTLNGGAGFDAVSFLSSATGIDLEVQASSITENSNDTLVSIENFILSDEDDSVGITGADTFVATMGGDDEIYIYNNDFEDVRSVMIAPGEGADEIYLEESYFWRSDGIYSEYVPYITITEGDAADRIYYDGIDISSIQGRANDIGSDIGEGYASYYWYVVDGNDNRLEGLEIGWSTDQNLGVSLMYYSEYAEDGEIGVSLGLGAFESGDFGITTGASYNSIDLRAELEAGMLIAQGYAIPGLDGLIAAVNSDHSWGLWGN